MNRKKLRSTYADPQYWGALLGHVPVEHRERVVAVATDSDGMRAAYTSRPFIRSTGTAGTWGYWDSDSDYYLLPPDPVGGNDWRNSLIVEPRTLATVCAMWSVILAPLLVGGVIALREVW